LKMLISATCLILATLNVAVTASSPTGRRRVRRQSPEVNSDPVDDSPQNVLEALRKLELLNEEVAEATVTKDIQIVKELEVDIEAKKEANAKLHQELAELGEKIGGATIQKLDAANRDVKELADQATEAAKSKVEKTQRTVDEALQAKQKVVDGVIDVKANAKELIEDAIEDVVAIKDIKAQAVADAVEDVVETVHVVKDIKADKALEVVNAKRDAKLIALNEKIAKIGEIQDVVVETLEGKREIKDAVVDGKIVLAKAVGQKAVDQIEKARRVIVEKEEVIKQSLDQVASTLEAVKQVKTKAGRDQKVVLDRLSDDLSQAKADIGRAVEESKESITTALVDTVDVVVDTTLLLKDIKSQAVIDNTLIQAKVLNTVEAVGAKVAKSEELLRSGLDKTGQVLKAVDQKLHHIHSEAESKVRHVLDDVEKAAESLEPLVAAGKSQIEGAVGATKERLEVAQDDILEKHRKLTNFLFNVDLFAGIQGTAAAKETASPVGKMMPEPENEMSGSAATKMPDTTEPTMMTEPAMTTVSPPMSTSTVSLVTTRKAGMATPEPAVVTSDQMATEEPISTATAPTTTNVLEMPSGKIASDESPCHPKDIDCQKSSTTGSVLLSKMKIGGHEFGSRSLEVPADEEGHMCDDETEDGSCGGGGPVDRSLEVEFSVGESDLPMDPKQEMKDNMQQKSRSVLDFFNFLNFNLF